MTSTTWLLLFFYPIILLMGLILENHLFCSIFITSHRLHFPDINFLLCYVFASPLLRSTSLLSLCSRLGWPCRLWATIPCLWATIVTLFPCSSKEALMFLFQPMIHYKFIWPRSHLWRNIVLQHRFVKPLCWYFLRWYLLRRITFSGLEAQCLWSLWNSKELSLSIRVSPCCKGVKSE